MAGSPSGDVDGGSGGGEIEYNSENNTGAVGNDDFSTNNRTISSLWDKKLKFALEGIKENGEATPKAIYHLKTYCENKKLMEEVATLQDKHDNPAAENISQEELDKLWELVEKGETREDKKRTRYDEGLRLRALLYRLLLGAFIAYALLGIYIWTIVNFSGTKCEGLLALDEATAKDIWTLNFNLTIAEYTEDEVEIGFQQWMEICRGLYTGPMEIIHNVRSLFNVLLHASRHNILILIFISHFFAISLSLSGHLRLDHGGGRSRNWQWQY